MNLKKLRTQKHITVVGIVNDLKISRNTFMKIEEGRSDLPARCVDILADIYGTSVEDIIEAHKKDIELYHKKELLNQLDEAENFLKKKDRVSVK